MEIKFKAQNWYYCYDLQPVKGHEEFIHMASLLIHKGNGVIFEIIGGDIYEWGRLAKILPVSSR